MTRRGDLFGVSGRKSPYLQTVFDGERGFRDTTRTLSGTLFSWRQRQGLRRLEPEDMQRVGASARAASTAQGEQRVLDARRRGHVAPRHAARAPQDASTRGGPERIGDRPLQTSRVMMEDDEEEDDEEGPGGLVGGGTLSQHDLYGRSAAGQTKASYRRMQKDLMQKNQQATGSPGVRSALQHAVEKESEKQRKRDPGARLLKTAREKVAKARKRVQWKDVEQAKQQQKQHPAKTSRRRAVSGGARHRPVRRCAPCARSETQAPRGVSFQDVFDDVTRTFALQENQ